MFRDWETEVEARIEAIRAERTGQGVSLTARQARALAGEWYEWFVARHPVSERQKWETFATKFTKRFTKLPGMTEWERSDPDELWREDAELRKWSVRSSRMQARRHSSWQ